MPAQRTIIACLAAWVAAAAPWSLPGASAQDAAADSPILLKAAKIYTGDAVIENGAVLLREGKIAAIGSELAAPEGARVIDRPGATLTAGLIDANVAVSLFRGGNAAEHASEVIPELEVIDLIDLRSRPFQRLAAAGVTTVYISADSASVIGGQGAVLRTAGPDNGRVIRHAHGVKATVGREPIYKASRNRTPRGTTSFLTRRPNTRMGMTWVFRKAFHDARAFSEGRLPPTRGEGSANEQSLPILAQILKGDVPLRIQARAQIDILSAIRLTNEFGMTFILEEGIDANRCVQELKDNKIPVIYGPFYDYVRGVRSRAGDARRNRYSTPKVLLDAGLTVALSANDQTGEAGLPQQAMYAMRFGLSRRQALAAVTTTPAALLGIDDIAGKLETGRPADLVLWSGPPFDAATRADLVIIGGRIVHDATGD